MLPRRALGSLQQNDLVSQRYLLGEELGICGNIKGSSRSTLIRSLKERSDEILDGKKNQYRPFQSCAPNHTTNVKKLYYATVNLQAVFCAKFVFSEANQVASGIFHQVTDHLEYLRNSMSSWRLCTAFPTRVCKIKYHFGKINFPASPSPRNPKLSDDIPAHAWDVTYMDDTLHRSAYS